MQLPISGLINDVYPAPPDLTVRTLRQSSAGHPRAGLPDMLNQSPPVDVCDVLPHVWLVQGMDTAHQRFYSQRLASSARLHRRYTDSARSLHRASAVRV